MYNLNSEILRHRFLQTRGFASEGTFGYRVRTVRRDRQHKEGSRTHCGGLRTRMRLCHLRTRYTPTGIRIVVVVWVLNAGRGVWLLGVCDARL